MIYRTILSLALLVSSGDPAPLAQAPPSVARPTPIDRQATERTIRASLARGQFDEALSAYDRYPAAARQPDAPLLAEIARASLKHLTQAFQTDPLLFAGSFERLAADGDTDALATLRKAAVGSPAGSPNRIAIEQSLVRLADKDATARVARLLDSVSDEGRADTIKVIEEAGLAAAAPQVARFLNDPAPQVRAVAAEALGVLNYRAAVPQLQKLFAQDSVETVRIFAAMALKRLGDSSADAYVANLLTAQNPDMRLSAAAAYAPATKGPWISAVRDLRNDRNELVRIRAAELLACCEVSTSRAVLADALNSPIPLIRSAAARVYDTKDLADIRLARRMLGDSYEVVRMYAAGEALRLARASQSPR